VMRATLPVSFMRWLLLKRRWIKKLLANSVSVRIALAG
jgi:hypothetical protein